MQPVPSNGRSPLLPIFLIVLIDVLGFTIVIPLLAYYAESFGASPLVATTLVSVYAVCSLISTPIIGKLSDQYGRRPLLVASQLGTCAGFLVLAFANALWMVFLGRILDGLTAGNLSTAQAYISDHTKPEDRAKAFGIIGIAFGFGFMFGPALGGVLAHYQVALPVVGDADAAFVVAAALSALSITTTLLLLPRDRGTSSTAVVGPGGRRPSAFDWRTYAEYFGRPHLRAIYVQFLLFSFAFSMFFSGFALFAEHNPDLRWGARQVGWLFAYSGLLGILIQGSLLGRLVKRVGEYKLTLITFSLSVLSYSWVGISHAWWMLAIGSTIGAFGHGILRPVLTARLTQAVGRHEQGVVLGISGSLSSVAMAFAPPTGGAFLDRHAVIAWAMVPAAISLIGLVVTLVWTGKSPPTTTN